VEHATSALRRYGNKSFYRQHRDLAAVFLIAVVAALVEFGVPSISVMGVDVHVRLEDGDLRRRDVGVLRASQWKIGVSNGFFVERVGSPS
jgi:hypothetical protein